MRYVGVNTPTWERIMSRNSQTSTAKDIDADDIVWGVEGPGGIAAVIGRTPVQTYYLIRKNRLPVRKLGHRTIVASRRRLLEYIAGDLPASI